MSQELYLTLMSIQEHMQKKVLLISPDYMGLYQDISQGLKELGFIVNYIPEVTFPRNPFNLVTKNRPRKSKEDYLSLLLNYWKQQLDNVSADELFYDYILVIDGLSIHPYLFEKLRYINKNVISICYLFDRVKGIYQIDHNFMLFDKVYSFDLSDSLEYKLEHFPIYWIPTKECRREIDVFAFGAYDKIRMVIYKRLKDICKKNGFKGYIKLFVGKINNPFIYSVKRFIIHNILRRDMLSLSDLKSPMFTHNSISSFKFREYIMKSKVIVDTNRPYQDGLTARFMWALGCGKKIITSNAAVSHYDFYTNNQILIIDDSVSDVLISEFIKTNFEMPDKIRKIVNQYRIDNWLKKILYMDEQDNSPA